MRSSDHSVARLPAFDRCQLRNDDRDSVCVDANYATDRRTDDGSANPRANEGADRCASDTSSYGCADHKPVWRTRESVELQLLRRELHH
jgi:hypothetical protein